MKHAFVLSSAALALVLGAATAQAQQTTSADSAAPAAVTAAPADSAHPAQAQRPRRNPNVLTAEDIAATHASTAYQAVSQLRSRWLRDRPGEEHDEAGDVAIQVYRNGQLAGDVNALRQIAAGDVATIEWVGPMQARVRYGPRGSHGVIAVIDKH